MLASLVLPNFFGAAKKARVKTAVVQMSSLATTLDAFALDVGRYPNDQEGLDALVTQPAGLKMWGGPYLIQVHGLDKAQAEGEDYLRQATQLKTIWAPYGE